MLYLLDASSIITAQDGLYGINIVPEYWSWLQFQASSGICKIPKEIIKEIAPIDSQFKEWLSTNRNALQLASEVRTESVRHVMENGYGANLSEVELAKIGGDALLIAAACEGRRNRCVVTEENSRPSATRANRKIPDVCRELGVSCMTTNEFVRKLEFTTDWEKDAPESGLFPSSTD